ncbi:MAG TPA: hypothetical protein VKE70_29490 [Candidatus Solibacter sp.]|nr:hypothetical protein [Candidatus Solibacter sp.]
MSDPTELTQLKQEIRRLEQRVNRQRWRLGALSLLCLLAPLSIVITRPAPASASPAEPQILRVRGISVIDEHGVERVYIGAPVVDPIHFGKRFRRDGPASGILLFDREGNERSGYVTSDTGRSNVFFTLDSLERQQVLFISPDEGGAHLRFFDKNTNSLDLGVTEKSPFVRMERGGQSVFQQPQ